MFTTLKNLYYTSSSEFGKVRIDRYRAIIGNEKDEQQMLLKITRWKDQPVIEVNKKEVYKAALHIFINTNATTGKQYINNSILFLQKEGSTEGLYTYIFSSSSNNKNPVEKDDLPF